MKLHITEAFKLLFIKVFIQRALHASNMSEEESIKLQVSSFLHLTLAIYKHEDSDITTNWIINVLQTYLSKYTQIEFSTAWPELTSQVLLEKVDGKIFLRLRSDNVFLTRQAEKLLMVPENIVQYVKTNNIASDTNTPFEISVEGLKDDEVIPSLITVIHNAYNRSFFYPGLIDSSDLTTIRLFGNNIKNELLNPFYRPAFTKKNDIILDVRQLLPDVIFDLVQWLKHSIQSQQIILIGSKGDVASVKVELFTGLSVEAYKVL